MGKELTRSDSNTKNKGKTMHNPDFQDVDGMHGVLGRKLTVAAKSHISMT